MTTGSGSTRARSAKSKTGATGRARSAKSAAPAPAADELEPTVDLEAPLAMLSLEQIAAHVMGAIVADHEALSIVRHNEPDKVRISIGVAPDDLGKVIGKQGRTINSLRTIVKMAAAARSDTQVAIDLEGRPE